MFEPAKKQEEVYDTVHTKLSYWLIVISAIYEFYLGFRYFNSPDPYSQNIGFITLMESGFAVIGLLLLDPISGNGFHLYPKHFRKISNDTLTHLAITFAALEIAQYAINRPLVSIPEIAAAIIFAAPAEEAMFRGVILTAFLQLAVFSNTSVELSKKHKFGFFEATGIFLSSLFFMFIHANYYNDPALMETVFVCGIILAASYWFWRDLSAIILAHLLLNIICVYTKFFMVVF